MEAIRHDNVLAQRPEYRFHRLEVGTPVVADTAVFANLPIAGAINCAGWRTLTGFVTLAGGAAPTVTLQLLHLTSYVDIAGVQQKKFVPSGYVTAPLEDGQAFSVVVGEGAEFLRIHAVAGNPTSVSVLLAGDARDDGTDTDRSIDVLANLLLMVGSLSSIAAVDFATEDTLLSLALRFGGRKLGTDGQVLGVSSVPVISAQLTEGLWELIADKAIWYKQGDAAVVAGRQAAESAYLPADERRLLVVTAASDDYLSIVAAVDPANDFPSQVDLLNRLKTEYEAHRVSAPLVHAHADVTNAVTAATATDLATAETLANDIKAQLNLHFLEDSLLEECCTLLTEMKADYNAHRVLIAGGVHGAADAVNVVAAADASTLNTAVTLANEIRTMYEAHRVLVAGGEHGIADAVNVMTAPASGGDLSSLVALCLDLKVMYEAHRVLVAGVHGAADAVNVVTSDDPGTADVHKIDDTRVVSAADAADLATLTTLVAELWADYNAHLNDLVIHSEVDQGNLLTWGTASLTLEE